MDVAGSRELSVDGKDVPGSQGTNTALGGPSTITFEVRFLFDRSGCGVAVAAVYQAHVVGLGAGHQRTTTLAVRCTLQVLGRKGTLSIASSRTLFAYTCTVDGETLVENNEAIGSSSTAPDVVMSVESGDRALDDDGKPVVWYRLRTTLSCEGAPMRTVVVHRRFKVCDGTSRLWGWRKGLGWVGGSSGGDGLFPEGGGGGQVVSEATVLSEWSWQWRSVVERTCDAPGPVFSPTLRPAVDDPCVCAVLRVDDRAHVRVCSCVPAVGLP
jgi:hypothetical protein